MPIINLASLPNSRVKPRNATRNANVKSVSIPAQAVTKLIDANADRTYLFIYNTSTTESLKYGYANDINQINFTLGPDRGIDLESLGEVYVFASNALTVEYDEGQG